MKEKLYIVITKVEGRKHWSITFWTEPNVATPTAVPYKEAMIALHNAKETFPEYKYKLLCMTEEQDARE